MYGGSTSRNRITQNRDQWSQTVKKPRPGVSTSGEPLKLRPQSALCGLEVGAVALLLSSPTLPRTLWPAHEAWAAALHMVGEVLWHLVQLTIAAATEECHP